MKQGFSLVELSIVLVILGLLTGGILAGQSLIRASELRAVTSEYQRYVAAANTFRDKYFAIPGDFRNAVSFWTADAACPSVVATANNNVCNGDGNGLIQNSTSSNELFGFWEHLGRAGLIEGSYNGAPNSAVATAYVSNLGVNVPRSKISNAGWSTGAFSTIAIADTTYFDGDFGNPLVFGSGTATINPTAALKPEEAWNIDTKMDDGRPATGLVVSLESQALAAANTAGCSNPVSSAAATMAASQYTLANTGTNCSLVMKSGY